jgi:hypothetical protein
VYRVRFEPKPRGGHHLDLDVGGDDNDDDATWKAVVLIDTAEYQPVSVTTDLAAKIPLAVKVLRTDIKGLGFSISYERFETGFSSR